MSTKPSSTQTRRARRAAERRERYDTARDQRRARAAASSGGSTWMTTRNLTLGAIGIGVLLVAVLAISQLGGASSSGANLKDPGIEYPAAIQDGTALGSASAPVVMEVWGDFQCPICGRHSLDVEPSLVNSYVIPNELRIVHHEIDILGRGGDESRLPAIGAYCANEQDRYWSYAHWVYGNQQGENQGGFRRDRLVQIAVAAGLDQAQFTACLDSQPAADAFAATQAQGQQLGINQTPTMFLNGTRYVGLKSATEWGQLIEAELAKGSASPAASASAAP